MPLDDNAPSPVIGDTGAGAAQTTNENTLNRQLSAVVSALGEGSSAAIAVLNSIASAITSSIIGGTTGATANRALVSKGTTGRALQPTPVSIDPATGDIDTNGGDIDAGDITADTGTFSSALTLGGVSVAIINQVASLPLLFIAPEDGSFKMVVKSTFAWTITETTTITEAGTSTVTISINATPLGGTANSASTSEQSQSHSSANAVAVGDDLTVTFASTSSDCEKLSLNIAGTTVLA